MPEDRPIPAAIRERMEEVRENNRTFWTECARSNGLSSGTPVRLAANFLVQKPDERERLSAALDSLGYVITEERAVPKKRDATWVVFEPPIQTWTLQGWNDWTDNMVLVGARVRVAWFGGIYSIDVIRQDQALLERESSEQRQMNIGTWAQLEQHGVTSSTELALEAHFWTKDRTTALLLAAHLRNVLGYVARVDAPKRRLLRPDGPWSVTGTTAPLRTNPSALNSWTDQMVRTAHEQGVTFDGWGTELPSSL